MLKIFVTGDNHIGLAYNGHKEKRKLINTRIDAFKAMVRNANDEACDLFVITGDLFDSTDPKQEYVQKLIQYLRDFKGEVLILPGNHDFCGEDDVLWKRISEEISGCGNIRILNEFRPYDITCGSKDVLIYPAYCPKYQSSQDENNLGWIKDLNITADEVFRIGIAHGTIEGCAPDNDEKYFVMTRDELEAIPVDAWLIGHTHTQYPDDLDDTMKPCHVRVFNAGSHCQCHVNNRTEGVCFILEIEEGVGKKNIRAKKFISGSIRFLRKEIKLAPEASLAETLERELAVIDKNTVLEISVKGSASDEEYSERNSIIEKALEPFLEGTHVNDDIHMNITDDFIDREFAETSIPAMLLKMLGDRQDEKQLLYDALREKKGGKR